MEWINAFRQHADRPDIGVLATFLFATGARIAEALDVRWEDIDLKRRKVLIRQTKLGAEREAHLPPDLFVGLANLPRDRKPFPWKTAPGAIPHWKRTIERANIDRLSFHSCRHGFATSLAAKGVDVKTIAALGGWKSAQHLFNTYLHATEDATLTDRLFDTPTDTAKSVRKTNQRVKP